MTTSFGPAHDTTPEASTQDDAAVLDRLHGVLINKAKDAGLLEVSYQTLRTPVGELLLAASDDGLVRIAFAREGHETVLADLARAVSSRILQSDHRLEDAFVQIEEYFAGRRTSFDLRLDTRLSKGFRRTVLDYLPRIGFGETQSYAHVARAVGNSRAWRAVGSACATNPLPIVIPCHRVVRTDGSFGPYLGGVETKATLLAMEAAA